MTALRAQMNPHFIFNCLNSINRFIIVSDNETASEYLTKFSRLIRLVLDNSRAEQITLERELETLRLYIEMEKLRFVDRFDCSISIDEQIPVSQTYIQPMLVQPYVENAIWHGLMHLKQGGLLDIRMQLINDQLVVSIIDNGIGRQKSMSMKSVQMISNSSHGMKVTAERLALLNSKMDAQARVVITDLSDELNQPAGTIVELFLPFDQNFHAQNTIQQNLVQ
jgi:LytS/YehU family sensor histidine kinase